MRRRQPLKYVPFILLLEDATRLPTLAVEADQTVELGARPAPCMSASQQAARQKMEMRGEWI